MSEWGMADIVNQRQGFRQIYIEAQARGDSSRNLRDLNGVRQTIAEVVRKPAREHLCLVFQAPERPRVDNAVAIALVVVAVRVRRLGITPSAALFDPRGVRSQHENS